MSQTQRGWLLDTNIISELRKGARANPGVLAWAQSVPPAACYISAVTLAEIRFGIERAGTPEFRAVLEAWLRNDVRLWFGERILPVTEDTLLIWRRLAAEGQAANYTYSQPDALIAATALQYDLAVVTRNARDFARAGVYQLDPFEPRA